MKTLALLLALIVGPAWSQALNLDVTQDNIGSTICVPNWAATVRPPTAYTGALKRRLLKQAGLPLASSSEYELDHVVPLSLGGAPRDPKNLRLQLWDGPDGAHTKDVIEWAMRRSVCKRRVTLEAAQSCMAGDWHSCRGNLVSKTSAYASPPAARVLVERLGFEPRRN